MLVFQQQRHSLPLLDLMIQLMTRAILLNNSDTQYSKEMFDASVVNIS
jgi:hypothetical protein